MRGYLGKSYKTLQDQNIFPIFCCFLQSNISDVQASSKTNVETWIW